MGRQRLQRKREMLHQRKFRGENYIGRVLWELSIPSSCPMAEWANSWQGLVTQMETPEYHRLNNSHKSVSFLLQSCFPDI